MLILTRRIGEALIIGDDIEVHVLGVKGNQVRLGIDAPKDISVHRKEIYDRIHADKNGKDGVPECTENELDSPVYLVDPNNHEDCTFVIYESEAVYLEQNHGWQRITAEEYDIFTTNPNSKEGE